MWETGDGPDSAVWEERDKGVVGPPELIPWWTMSVNLPFSLRERPSR